jgi:hypothetical protein
MAEESAHGHGLSAWVAAALVFGSSAAVLVVELVALRLLAPHYGLTLETNTPRTGSRRGRCSDRCSGSRAPPWR